MKKIDINKLVLDIIIVTIGCILTAFSITSILKPNGLITGGITGISIILESFIHIKYTYIYYVLSILVLLSAWLTMGKKEALKIITLSIFFPLVLIVLENIDYSFIQNDMLLSCVYFGIIYGLGVGLVLKRGFSFGGTDTIAKVLHCKLFNFISISEILLAIDGAIIAYSAIVYSKNIALYAIISQFITMKVIDSVMFGFTSKKVQIEIISSKHEEITNYVLHTIRRGVSTYDIKGGYNKQLRLKLQIVCSPRESMLIKSFIAKVDPDAFIHVVPIISVWGKGAGFNRLVEEN
ncbi:YitT family protein [Clostridium swellfunianum]|uniref:YitT family protein n=1 Tax=Clostridium swellfunianum TaxID=1367462 RepID=UPI0020305216|nr:YitT family protein [Clostridium swellfunianum]MCM0647642.1 YitT family protein [Clostridium swellfunianum]